MRKRHPLNRLKYLSTFSILACLLSIPIAKGLAAESGSADTRAQIIITQKDKDCVGVPAGKSKDGKSSWGAQGCVCQLNGKQVNLNHGQFCTPDRKAPDGKKRDGK